MPRGHEDQRKVLEARRRARAFNQTQPDPRLAELAFERDRLLAVLTAVVAHLGATEDWVEIPLAVANTAHRDYALRMRPDAERQVLMLELVPRKPVEEKELDKSSSEADTTGGPS